MTAWRDLAACAGMSGPDRDPWADRGLEAEAKAVCAGCPVVAECLANATDDRHTVRGGLSAEERAALAEDPEVLPGMPQPEEPVVAEHSRAAYVAKVHGTDCRDCARVNAAYKNEWLAEKRAKAQSHPEQADWQMTFDMEATA